MRLHFVLLFVLLSQSGGFDPLPKLNIDPKSVWIAGCSHAGDFAHQFHVAYSSLVTGACIFAGQPYHCATTYFTKDQLVVKTNSSSVPNCDGCPPFFTLVYDHCKNHPQWVDVGKLPDYPRRHCGQNSIQENCIDDVKHLFDSRVFLFRGTHDRCYLEGAVANVQALYYQLLTNPGKQVKFVRDQPFPHCLPVNSTAHFNSTTPAGYDGPGECLKWLANDTLNFAGEMKRENVVQFDQQQFFDESDLGTGLQLWGFLYIPDDCKSGTLCKLMMLPNGCGPIFEDDTSTAMARWGQTNNIVILKLCVGGYVDKKRFPQAPEIQRGLLDVYGQLSSDYATQSSPHMKVFGRILKALIKS